MRRSMKWSAVAIVAMVGLGLAWHNAATAAGPQRPVSATCTIEVNFEFLAQAGGAPRVETYTKTFTVVEGVPFFDDFSTLTRFKDFRATVARSGKDTVVSIDWFADVGVFDSADFSTALNLGEDRKPHSASSRSAYWNSFTGQATTTYKLTGVQLN